MTVRNLVQENWGTSAFIAFNVAMLPVGFQHGQEMRRDMGTHGNVAWESAVTGVTPAIGGLCQVSPSEAYRLDVDFNDVSPLCNGPLVRASYKVSDKLGGGLLQEGAARVVNTAGTAIGFTGLSVGAIAGHAFEAAKPGNDDQPPRRSSLETSIVSSNFSADL